jgi:hypothetical protein
MMTQEQAIVEFLKENGGYYTPEVIQYIIYRNTVPLTSIRRALSTLTRKGVTVKTKTRKPGNHGRLVHTWSYRG